MTTDLRLDSGCQSLNSELASFLVSLDYSDLPEHVVEKVKHQLTYFFGLALAGYPTVVSRDARALARALSPSGGASTIIGESFMVQPLDAAFANCSTAAGTGLDDVAFPPRRAFVGTSSSAAGTHPGRVTQPVAWALGEQQSCSGKDLITAVVAGYELMGKLGALVWAPTAPTLRRQIIPFGPFAATATAVKLLRLSVEETATALGFAANFAMGVAEGPVITHYYSVVCRNGIMAALLGRTDAEVPATVLEGQYGFFRTFFDENPEGLAHLIDRLETDRANGEFEILDTSIKCHPGTGLNIVPIQLMLQLVERDRLRAESVTSIRLFLSDSRAYHTASQVRGPYTDIREATFALPFMFAVILLDGWLNPGRYRQFENPQLLDLAARVRIEFEPDRTLRSARLEVTTVDGRTHAHEGDRHVYELPPDRLGWLREHNNGLLPDENLARLHEAIAGLEDVENVADVMACTRR